MSYFKAFLLLQFYQFGLEWLRIQLWDKEVDKYVYKNKSIIAAFVHNVSHIFKLFFLNLHIIKLNIFNVQVGGF